MLLKFQLLVHFDLHHKFLAYGWNDHILFTMNYLMTKKTDLNGVGRVFVGRYLLDAVNIDDAIKRLTEYSFAAGHNHQIIDRETGRLVDVEIAPFQFVGIIIDKSCTSMVFMSVLLVDLTGMQILIMFVMLMMLVYLIQLLVMNVLLK